ncbi:MAG: NAD-dependent epimerase/dehydratase family protein [Pseudomonadota bacterium]
MATVLVTGADGFVGRHLVSTLTARGDAVVALDLRFGSDDSASTGVTRLEGSVLDAALLGQAMSGVDAVIHAAAVADLHAPQGGHDRINRGGTEAVLAAAEAARARFLLVSSYTALVGRQTRAGETVDPRQELAPDDLLGTYPASKRRAERAVAASAARGIHALSVLPTAPVGEGDHRPTPPGRMILDLARGATPALIDTRIDLVDVAALAKGIVAALDKGQPGARYVLAGESLTLASLAEKIAALTGQKAPKARVPMAVALAAARVEAGIAAITGRQPTAPLTGVRLAARPVEFATERTESDLGWQRPMLDDALARSLGWYRAVGML